MDCTNCGYHLPDGARHCVACGAVLVHGPKSRGDTSRQSPQQAQAKVSAAKKVAAKEAAEKAASELAAKEAAEKEAAALAAKEAAEKEAAALAAKEAAEKEAAALAAIEAAETAAKEALPRLRYNIIVGSLPAVSITLNEGQSMIAQPGGMIWMNGGITTETQTDDIVAYTSGASGQELGIASRFPGTILDLPLGDSAIIIASSAFLCAQPTAELRAHISMQVPGGASFVFQRLSGHGLAFLGIAGSQIARTLASGEVLKTGTGSIAAFEESVTHQTEMAAASETCQLLSTLTGPGTVWMQTMVRPG